LGVDPETAQPEVLKSERPGDLERFWGVESPCMGNPRVQPFMGFFRGEFLASPWINGGVRSVGSGGHARPFLLDFPPGTEAWINQRALAKGVERRLISGTARALAKRGAMPIQPEPFEIILDLSVKFRTDPRPVDVFMTKQKASAGAALGD